MSSRTTAGAVLSISAAAPATFNAAGYAALTWTEIGEITDYGDFGREYTKVKHNPVASRGTQKKKGSFDEGTLDLTMALDTDDAGQILLKAASLSDSDYSFKLQTQNGDVYYFQAQVGSFKVALGNVDSISQAKTSLDITTAGAGVGIVEVLAA